MKSSNTKRILSVLSAGALVSSMGAMTAFASSSSTPAVAPTLGTFSAFNYTADMQTNASTPTVTFTGGSDKDTLSASNANTKYVKGVVTGTVAYQIPLETVDNGTRPGANRVGIKLENSNNFTNAQYGVASFDGTPSTWYDLSPNSPETFVVFHPAVKSTTEGDKIADYAIDWDGDGTADQWLHLEVGNSLTLEKSDYTGTDITATSGWDGTFSVGGKGTNNVTSSVSRKSTTTDKVQLTLAKPTNQNSASSATITSVTKNGTDATSEGYVKNTTGTVTFEAEYVKGNKYVVTMDWDGSSNATASSVVKYTIDMPDSSSEEEEENTATPPVTDTDFKDSEIKTETKNGVTTSFPESDTLRDKLNDNKGESFAIGGIKDGSKLVAEFDAVLPKDSTKVSANQVAQVINTLATINIKKSNTSNAQQALKDVLATVDTKNTAYMPISFSKDVKSFGFSVIVTVPVDSKFTNGGTFLYYYNPSSKALEKQDSVVTIRGGKASFELSHASDYFLVEGIKDLSAGEGIKDSEDTLSSAETTTAASEAPVVTAPVVDTTVASSAAPIVTTNPGTGNAPIALAVIPVAIAAAAVIAKKAK